MTMDSEHQAYRNCYFAMRHGQSQANQAGIIVSDPVTGLAGFGLTTIGESQVRNSAEGFQPPPGTLRVYSSDFLRARQTADLVHNILQLPGAVTLTSLLRERFFGAFDGLADQFYDEVWMQDAIDPNHCARGVESVFSVVARLSALLVKLEQDFDGDTILLVAHGDILQILQTVFEGISPARHRQLRPLEVATIRPLLWR